jgi:hypothetical protein
MVEDIVPSNPTSIVRNTIPRANDREMPQSQSGSPLADSRKSDSLTAND